MTRETGYYWVKEWNNYFWTIWHYNKKRLEWWDGCFRHTDGDSHNFTEINETRILNPDEVNLHNKK